MTKPSRPASNGRLARAGSSLRVESAFIELNPAMESGVTAASAPPASITSARPSRIMSAASPSAWLPDAQAVTVQERGPVKPSVMDAQAAPMLAIMVGTNSGDTRSAPRA